MTETSTETTPGAASPDSSTSSSTSHLYGCPITYSHGQQVIHVHRDRYLEIINKLKDDGFNMLIDVTSVDYSAAPGRPLPDDVVPERFELVVNLISHSRRRRIRLRVQIPETNPSIPTLYDIFPGSEAMEREVYDLMGIIFDDHPDLTRILMPEEWEGHPLRKDYSQGRIPVQFKYPEGKYSEADTVRSGQSGDVK